MGSFGRTSVLDDKEVIDLKSRRNEILSSTSSSASLNRFQTWPKLLGAHHELLLRHANKVGVNNDDCGNRRLHHVTPSDVGRVQMLVRERCLWSPLYDGDETETNVVDDSDSSSLVSAIMDDDEYQATTDERTKRTRTAPSSSHSSFVMEEAVEITDHDSYTSSSLDDVLGKNRNDGTTDHFIVPDRDDEGMMMLWNDEDVESIGMKDDPQETLPPTTNATAATTSKGAFCPPQTKYERQIIRRLMLHFLRLNYHSCQGRCPPATKDDDIDYNDDDNDVDRDLLLFDGIQNVVAVVWMAMMTSDESRGHRTAMTYLVLHQLASYPWGCHTPWNMTPSHVEEKFIRLLTNVVGVNSGPLYDWIIANRSDSSSSNNVIDVITKSWIPSWFSQDIPNLDMLLRLWDVLIISHCDFVFYFAFALIRHFQDSLLTGNIDLQNIPRQLLCDQSDRKKCKKSPVECLEGILSDARDLQDTCRSETGMSKPPHWFVADTAPTDFAVARDLKQMRLQDERLQRTRGYQFPGGAVVAACISMMFSPRPPSDVIATTIHPSYHGDRIHDDEDGVESRVLGVFEDGPDDSAVGRSKSTIVSRELVFEGMDDTLTKEPSYDGDTSEDSIMCTKRDGRKWWYYRTSGMCLVGVVATVCMVFYASTIADRTLKVCHRFNERMETYQDSSIANNVLQLLDRPDLENSKPFSAIPALDSVLEDVNVRVGDSPYNPAHEYDEHEYTEQVGILLTQTDVDYHDEEEIEQYHHINVARVPVSCDSDLNVSAPVVDGDYPLSLGETTKSDSLPEKESYTFGAEVIVEQTGSTLLDKADVSSLPPVDDMSISLDNDMSIQSSSTIGSMETSSDDVAEELLYVDLGQSMSQSMDRENVDGGIDMAAIAIDEDLDDYATNSDGPAKLHDEITTTIRYPVQSDHKVTLEELPLNDGELPTLVEEDNADDHHQVDASLNGIEEHQLLYPPMREHHRHKIVERRRRQLGKLRGRLQKTATTVIQKVLVLLPRLVATVRYAFGSVVRNVRQRKNQISLTTVSAFEPKFHHGYHHHHCGYQLLKHDHCRGYAGRFSVLLEFAASSSLNSDNIEDKDEDGRAKDTAGVRVPLPQSGGDATGDDGNNDKVSSNAHPIFTDDEWNVLKHLHKQATMSSSTFHHVLQEALPTLSPSTIIKLRALDTASLIDLKQKRSDNDEDEDDASSSSVTILGDLSSALHSLLDDRLSKARDVLQALLGAGEIKRLDALIGQAARAQQLDVAFFQVLQMNLLDAKASEAASRNDEIATPHHVGIGDDDLNDSPSSSSSLVTTPSTTTTFSNTRYQILQHIYTRCQEEVEKTIEPGMALLNKLLRTEQSSIRQNQLKHYLCPQSNIISAPDGKQVILGTMNGNKTLVEHGEFCDAIAKAVEQIRGVQAAGGTSQESAATMVESCRQVAKEARTVLVMEYGGIEAPEVTAFEMALLPVFRPSSSDSPYITG